MPQDINTGSSYNTKVPSLTDTADIVTAFTNYHYGITTGTAPADANVTSQQGIAGWLKDLDTTKADLASPTFTGTVELPAATSIGNVSSIEIGYLDGVTSAIQTQINSKQNKATAPVTTSANYTVLSSDTFIICKTNAVQLTLPTASLNTGRILNIKTISAKAVTSATSNVVPLISETPGTAILSATIGKWAQLVSNGTNWVIMSAN